MDVEGRNRKRALLRHRVTACAKDRGASWRADMAGNLKDEIKNIKYLSRAWCQAPYPEKTQPQSNDIGMLQVHSCQALRILKHGKADGKKIGPSSYGKGGH